MTRTHLTLTLGLIAAVPAAVSLWTAFGTTVEAAQPGAAPVGTVAQRVGQMPEAAASFGAVADDGWLYVYGGHISPTHNYSIEAVSGAFHRWNLRSGGWESLPAGPHVQGMNLAAHGGKIYRVGGMQPRNKAGEPQDTHSIADVARYDPSAKAWEPLPALPVARSSHDMVIVGQRLYVIGGWTMVGEKKADWPDTIDVLDLSQPGGTWTSLPQPFKRRAFIATADDKRIYVIGGFDENDRVVDKVDIFDVATGTWSSGPALPPGPMNGFGPAACVADGRVYISLGDGGFHRLSQAGTAWERVGTSTPRIVHRLIPDGSRVLILGGANQGQNSDLIEAMPLKP